MKHNANRIYIAVTAAALVLAAILLLNYEINRRAEESETVKTATTVAEKEKKDKVLISTSSETIRDGLANMGVLITQEYYFTQVETYTKEKNIFLIIPSSSGFMYSYDGAVLAGVDFEKIGVQTDEDRKVVTVDLPPSEIQAVTIDRDTFRMLQKKRLSGAVFWRGRISRHRSLSANSLSACPPRTDTQLSLSKGRETEWITKKS